MAEREKQKEDDPHQICCLKNNNFSDTFKHESQNEKTGETIFQDLENKTKHEKCKHDQQIKEA